MPTLATATKSHKRSVNMSLKVDPEEKQALQFIAQNKDRTVHHLMRQALTEFIAKEKARIEFYDTGKQAIEDYKATGLHVTMAEMRNWSKSLGTPNELPEPVCHV